MAKMQIERVGGIELELESIDTSFVPPPPPPQWGANRYQPGRQQNYPYGER